MNTVGESLGAMASSLDLLVTALANQVKSTKKSELCETKALHDDLSAVTNSLDDLR